MTAAQLDLVISRTGHERYRDLVTDGHPSCSLYRALIEELAGLPEPAQRPAWLALPRVQPVMPAPGQPCGCGQGRA